MAVRGHQNRLCNYYFREKHGTFAKKRITEGFSNEVKKSGRCLFIYLDKRIFVQNRWKLHDASYDVLMGANWKCLVFPRFAVRRIDRLEKFGINKRLTPAAEDDFDVGASFSQARKMRV